ncbi:MAG: hypothetical protein R2696_16860 [Microthrixaceae bacterium]
MASGELGPINIGNPDERFVLNLARIIIQLTDSRSTIEYRPLPQDDPVQRCPTSSWRSSASGGTPASACEKAWEPSWSTRMW